MVDATLPLQKGQLYRKNDKGHICGDNTWTKFVLQERARHHWPSAPSASPGIVLWFGRIIDNHLVSVLADQGKGKVWSHEENKVPHKGDHLGLIWMFQSSEQLEWARILRLCQPGHQLINSKIASFFSQHSTLDNIARFCRWEKVSSLKWLFCFVYFFGCFCFFRYAWKGR